MRSANRVQFSSTGTVPSPPTTPSKAAMNGLLTGFQALHETLRDNEVLTGIAEKFIRQYIILHSKEESLKKFDDDTYVPLSCRVKIDLKGSHRIRKSDKFANIREKLDATTKKFQEEASKHFQAVARLELDLIRADLAEMAVRFSDLLMKQKLLYKEDCRDHSNSNELITAVFISEPTNHARVDGDMIVDTQEAQAELDRNVAKLRFAQDDQFIYDILRINDPSGTQPNALHENEIELIMNTKKDLKNTLIRGICCFHAQLRKVKMIATTKEVLLESTTIDLADKTAHNLNEGNSDNDNDKLPQDAESLQDLIGAIVLEKLNTKKSNDSKKQKEVKEKRGAHRQGNQGGGASSNTNATQKKKKAREKLKKKKNAAAIAKKKANQAAAAARDSVAASSNKRRRPPAQSS